MPRRWRVVLRKDGYIELPPKKAKSESGDATGVDDDDDELPEFFGKQLDKLLDAGGKFLKFRWDDGETYRLNWTQKNSTISLKPLKSLSAEATDFAVAGYAGNAMLKRQFGKGQVVAIASFAFMRRAAILKEDAGIFAARLLEPYAKPAPKVEVPDAQQGADVSTANAVEVGEFGEANEANGLAAGVIAIDANPAPIIPAAEVAPRANPTLLVLGLHMEPKSLLQWLVKYGFSVLLAAFVLLLLWLWHIIPRFGPIAAAQTQARRNIADHWRAAGQYLLGRRQWVGLLRAPRLRVARRLRQRLGMVVHLPVVAVDHASAKVQTVSPNTSPNTQQLSSEQMARLEQVCKVSAGRIHSALNAVPETPNQLLAFIVTLRQMEAALK